jgi:integrase
MSSLREALHNYLTMRRGLGFKLHSEGAALSSFVAYMEQEEADYISTSLALAWAQAPTSVQPARWAQRLRCVRGFARYCSAIDPRTEIPSAGLLPFTHQRPTPYFFTDEDIRKLLDAALHASARDSMAQHTFFCLFGLLSVTGLRISEALGIAPKDVDLDEGILTIRSSKFGKSRLVPLHTSTITALVNYGKRREQILAGRQVPYWFANAQGTRVSYDVVRDAFRRLTKQIGLRSRSDGRRPHLHDLRHRFAMVTVLQWYRNGEDVERRLPVLSAYLGHVEVCNTYWYLSASPDLLEAAKGRLERCWEQRP